jgi:DNA-binding XRE family transcriptional regulator
MEQTCAEDLGMATIVHPQAQPRNAQGHYQPGSNYRSMTADERRRRAREWKKFRRDYLFSQAALAETLGITRRTVCSIEQGAVVPTFRVQKLFRDLVREQKRQAVA